MKDNGLRLIIPERERLREKNRRILRRSLLPAAALFAAALFLLPAARNGLMALLNRVMEASEAVNAYAYRRIPVSSPADEVLGGILLCGAAMCLGGAAVLRARRITGLAAVIICAGIQAWLGLSLPAAVNMAVFTLGGILAMDRMNLKKALCMIAAAMVLAGIVAAVWPGVDEPTEAVSEYVRDLLEHAAEPPEGGSPDGEPDMIRETRHTDTRSLTEGDREAEAEQQYRLITVEEEEISRPEWTDYLKIALLLLAAAAAVILPFIPAAVLNRKRRKAREARAAFDSPDRNEAVCAMFRHAAKYLDAAGFGAGNIPFCEWPEKLRGRMPEKYVDSFQKCCILFEEAAYSDHELTEAQAGKVRQMLTETERLLYDEAGWRQRLRLKYTECLHE